MVQLKPCKYCGSAAIYEHEKYQHLIYCDICDYETRIHEYSTDAVKEWNSKADQDTTRPRLQR